MIQNIVKRRTKCAAGRTNLQRMARDLSIAANAQVGFIFYPYHDDAGSLSPLFCGYPSLYSVVETVEGVPGGNGFAELNTALTEFNRNNFSAVQRNTLSVALHSLGQNLIQRQAQLQAGQNQEQNP